MTLKQRYFSNGVEKIISEMPDNLSDMEKVRYIYISLGELICFDERFMFGKAKTEKQMYKRAKFSAPSFSDIQEGKRKKLVCVSITKTLNAVLKKVGIDAWSVQEDYNDKHESTAFSIGGQTYKADLTADLKFIHLNLPTRHFAVLGSNTISYDELSQIDSMIGYEYSGRQIIDSYIQQLSKKLSTIRKLSDKVSMILEASSHIPRVKDLNYIERDSFYEYMLTHLIGSKDIVRLTKNVLYLQDQDDRYGFLSLYSTYDYDNSTKSQVFKRFLFSKKKKKFIEISDEDLQAFIEENNYHIHFGKRIPGLRNHSKRSHSSDQR